MIQEETARTLTLL